MRGRLDASGGALSAVDGIHMLTEFTVVQSKNILLAVRARRELCLAMEEGFSMKKIGCYIKLLGLFAKYSLMSVMEYRINFASGVLVEMGWMMVKLLYVVIVYRAGINIGMLTPDHIMLFIGTYTLMTGFYMLYYFNFTSLPDMVRQGELDLYIVKPVSLQFYVTMRRVDFALFLPNFLAGTVLIVTGWRRAGLPFTFLSVSGFLLFLLCGCLLTYSLFLLPYLLGFWILSVGGIADITAALWDFNNMPSAIYGKWMQRIGTFLLPVFVITNFPGLFLMGQLSAGMVIWGVTVPILFFAITRFVWKKAVRNYSSASS